MRLPFYEFEWMLDDIKEIQAERQSQAEAQEKQQRAMQNGMKNPYSNMKMPSFNNALPKMQMPTLPAMPSFNFR